MNTISNALRHGAGPVVVSSARPALRHSIQATKPDAVHFGSYRDRPSTSLVGGAFFLGVLGLLGGLLIGSNSGSPPVPPAPPVNITQKNVAIDVTPNWTGKTVSGQINGASVNVDLSSGWSGKTLKGSVNGNSVDETVSTNWGSRTITGSFGGKPVNLSIQPSGLSGKSITGTFQGVAVNVTIANNWGTRYITGNIDGRAVNLKSETEGFTGRKISGVIGQEKVSTTISSGLGSNHFTGGVQSEKPGSVEDNFLLNLMMFNQIRYSSGKTTHSMLDL